MFLSSLRKNLAMFRRATKCWRKPKRATVLIYDRNGADLFLEYVDPRYTEILDVRGESINLPVLFRCLLALDLLGKSYVDRYIATVRPSVILTFTDNQLAFYGLKGRNPTITSVAVQNGWRGIMSDMFDGLASNQANSAYSVDYLLTLGTAIGEKYREHIVGRTVPVGSFRSNYCARKGSGGLGSVVFISQYRPPPENQRQPSMGTIDSRVVTHEEFFFAERAVSSFLARYCEEKGLALEICGSNLPESGEYAFFADAIGHENWRFTRRSAFCDSYDLVDRAQFVVGIDSTLVYESLARGNRTAFFSIRKELFGDPAARFGWPAQLLDSGPFWTNHVDEAEFTRIMDYLDRVDDDAWREVLAREVPGLIDADPGNTRFLSLMRDLGVPVGEGIPG
jgi:surface carbohydrate biosynthesis protein